MTQQNSQQGVQNYTKQVTSSPALLNSGQFCKRFCGKTTKLASRFLVVFVYICVFFITGKMMMIPTNTMLHKMEPIYHFWTPKLFLEGAERATMNGRIGSLTNRHSKSAFFRILVGEKRIYRRTTTR